MAIFIQMNNFSLHPIDAQSRITHKSGMNESHICIGSHLTASSLKMSLTPTLTQTYYRQLRIALFSSWLAFESNE